jgi:hypothetical protein
MMMWSALYQTNTLSWICLVLAHWNWLIVKYRIICSELFSLSLYYFSNWTAWLSLIGQSNTPCHLQSNTSVYDVFAYVCKWTWETVKHVASHNATICKWNLLLILFWLDSQIRLAIYNQILQFMTFLHKFLSNSLCFCAYFAIHANLLKNFCWMLLVTFSCVIRTI